MLAVLAGSSCSTNHATFDAASAPKQSGHAVAAKPVSGARSPFSVDQLQSFMAGVKDADEILDPIERCLKYPDPPGSHWSQSGVAAYCHFRLQPSLNSVYLVSLVNHGLASDIDRRLGDYMHRQASILDPQDVLWRSMWACCSEFSSTQETRQALDEWKRKSPNSALAYVFSGFNYVNLAWKARGTEWGKDTSDVKFDAMQALLVKAKEDLGRAVEIDPKLVVAYASMINAGLLLGDRPYTEQAVRKGLATDSVSLAMYDMLGLMSQPRWGGTPEQQRELIEASLKDSVKNPLLLTVKASVLSDIYDLPRCDCTSQEAQLRYLETFDNVAQTSSLLWPGMNAVENHQPEIAYVYLSEALRFYPHSESGDALNFRDRAISELSMPQGAGM